jgi:cytochrome P450
MSATNAEPTNTAPTAPRNVPFLNVVDPSFEFTSPDVMAAQAASWYAESPVGLLVLRYAEAQELLRDRRLEPNGKEYLERNGIVDGPIYDWFVSMIINRDEADHRRLRGLVTRAFTPRVISNLRPFVRATAQRLTERLRAVEVCEFVNEFANPLPLTVMCELLGVPAEDYDTFSAWTADIGRIFSLAHGDDVVARVSRAIIGLDGYVDHLISRRESHPTGDLISALVAAYRDGGVSRDELRNLVVTLVFGAHDNTRHQLSNAMVSFAEHPGQWRLLAERPELADQAVDEVMRWRPSATSLFGFAAEDFDYRGLSIAKGTFIMMCIATAQRDPRVFPGGDSFDIAVPRPAPTLQFGGGPHYCLGAALARAELAEALTVLTGSLEAPSIAGPVTWRPPTGIHGPEMLPLRFG